MRTINGAVRLAVLQALACASGLVLAAPGRASADAAQFDIAAQPLPNALKSFAAQAKMQLLYRYDVVDHATASAVAGKLEKHVALEQLLRGTGLEAVYGDGNTATIRPAAGEEKPTSGTRATSGDTPRDPPPSSSVDKELGSIRLAQSETSTQPVRSGPPKAASGTDGPMQEVVITGVRRAIETSQEVKKNAQTFVDSITATDIGAFPDKSASDALQRLPGITVNRLQSNDDSTHPSGEPTNILIRGLTQVRTELNGRDAFSADSGRGLNF
ncbi:MAG TPA: TonB-dependent receptor plug domain-containing protein, partial [Steroidobacteraceae bacterium]|nr:TonB-dependent receptor plug domain-containing protein [Steroidobacteraceae bacterium]